MILRRKTRKVKIGNIFVGGDSPISVQSMLNKPSNDYRANVEQAKILESAGCELIRVSVNDNNSVYLVSKLKENINIPVISDIQFSSKYAIESIIAGVDGVRINPGNMDTDGLFKVVNVCNERNIPIRIGFNGGSVKDYVFLESNDRVNSFVSFAMNFIKLFESWEFENMVISLKTSSIETTVKSYEKISSLCDYPLHIGISESGTEKSGLIRSCIGIGSLLLKGIGDTLRLSLSADPLKEVQYGIKILKFLGLRDSGVQVVSCPTCGRSSIDVEYFANEIEKKLGNLNKNIKIAVMGCPVNGPGEARDADFGVTGVDGKCLIFKNGEILKKVDEKDLLPELTSLIDV